MGSDLSKPKSRDKNADKNKVCYSTTNTYCYDERLVNHHNSSIRPATEQYKQPCTNVTNSILTTTNPCVSSTPTNANQVLCTSNSVPSSPVLAQRPPCSSPVTTYTNVVSNTTTPCYQNVDTRRYYSPGRYERVINERRDLSPNAYSLYYEKPYRIKSYKSDERLFTKDDDKVYYTRSPHRRKEYIHDRDRRALSRDNINYEIYDPTYDTRKSLKDVSIRRSRVGFDGFDDSVQRFSSNAYVPKPDNKNILSHHLSNPQVNNCDDIVYVPIKKKDFLNGDFNKLYNGRESNLKVNDDFMVLKEKTIRKNFFETEAQKLENHRNSLLRDATNYQPQSILRKSEATKSSPYITTVKKTTTTENYVTEDLRVPQNAQQSEISTRHIPVQVRRSVTPQTKSYAYNNYTSKSQNDLDQAEGYYNVQSGLGVGYINAGRSSENFNANENIFDKNLKKYYTIGGVRA